MKLSSADAALRHYVRLHEQLTAPKSGRSVLESGPSYGEQCITYEKKRGYPDLIRCPSRTWEPKLLDARSRSYMAVCSKCRKPWPVFQADIRAGQVSHKRGDAMPRALDDLGTLVAILARVPLWPMRIWQLRVLGPANGVQWSNWEEFAEAARKQRWQSRRGTRTYGCGFSERHCRTLVYEARDLVERGLKRAKLWEDEEIQRDLARPAAAAQITEVSA